MTEPDQGFQDPAGTDIPAEESVADRAPYADYLDKLPDSVKPLVEPMFKEWDSNTGRKFQEVHSEYEDVKPWKDFAKRGVKPDQAEQALQILDRINQDPRSIWEALGKSFNFTSEQGQLEQPPGEESDEGEYDPLKDPRFAQVDQLTRTMAEYLVEQENQKQAAIYDRELTTTLETLKSKHGDFDEEYVLTAMANGLEPDKAVERYNAVVEAAIAKRQQPKVPPVVLGSGGGMPQTPVNLSQASPADRKKFVQEQLARLAQNS